MYRSAVVAVLLVTALVLLWTWSWDAEDPVRRVGSGDVTVANTDEATTGAPEASERSGLEPSVLVVDSERTPIILGAEVVDKPVGPPLPMWTASGRAIAVDTNIDPSKLRVSYGVGTSLREPLGVVDVSESGEWGPVELEFTGSFEYWFRLDGGGVIPELRRITPEMEGQAIVLDLEARPGEELWFEVYGEDDEQLADALVEVRWKGDGQTALTWARPREDGYVWVRGCKPGTVTYEASAPGYSSMIGSPRLVPEADPAVIQVYLYRTGRVKGTCKLDGIPVKDFDVVYWPASEVNDKQTMTFTDRVDGTFEIPAVRVGNARLLAVSKALAQGAPVEVVVRVGMTTKANLELSHPLRGAGRVVDRASGLPVSEARIRLFSSSDGRAIQAWGEVVRSGLDGSFELDGLSSELQYFTVRAKGYGAIYGEAIGDRDGLAEIGAVLISRTQDLEIRISDVSVLDPSMLSIDAGSETPIERLSRDGVVQFRDIQAASRAFWVEGLPSTRVNFKLDLVSDEDWTFDVSLFGERTLTLDVAMVDGSDLPDDLRASVVPLHRAAFPVEHGGRVPGDGMLTVPYLPWDKCSLVISSDDRRSIHEHVVVDFKGRANVDLHVELQAELRKLRVVDQIGRIVPSIDVVFYGMSTQVTMFGMTDANGLLEVGPAPDGIDRVVLHQQSEGLAIAVPVDLTGDPAEEIVLVYDATRNLRARFLDGDSPAFGIRARLGADGYPGLIAEDRESGSDGLVEWRQLNRAEFIVSSTHRDYWPTRSALVPGSPSPHVIQVRRLGGIELHVTDEIGQAVAGAAVGLRSSEFGESLQQWIEAGRIEPVQGGLVTNASGSFRVTGLPHGEYVVTVASSLGRYEAVVVIEPGDPARVAVVLR